ncbi:MAG: hypothetical protein OEZ55_03670 [Nitrospinota bacterium]|nr:hypothetical protein [Nitrospinota bacterium]MDH5755748.1 hypothetical protein [Nitrospinota bacterium]
MNPSESEYLADDLQVAGKRLSLVGILHSKEEFKKNEAEFERMIKPYSAVMLEQPLWYVDFSYDQSSFGQLAAIAMKMNKKVYIADPFDARVLAADAAFAFGGLSMLVKSSIDLGKYSFGKKPEGLSRRGLILRAGMLALGLPMFFGSLPGLDLRSAMDKESAYTYGLDDKMTWGSKDWRDLWIAMGIEKVLSDVKELNTMIAFHGKGHQQGILHYLLHPEDRRRQAAYEPFKRISAHLGVREWVPKKHKWELARVF